uniref:Antibacterial peptide PBSIP n=1 Tax=Protaetia brevitarsis seulensis TaxID=438893 RepID=A9XG03_PROBE|nr:antibacterial peptide PBSIP [Protaetia brevitarsis seulensis]
MFHSTMSSLLCTFLIFLGLTSAVFAFQCYECNSVAEPKCLEELDVWTPPLVNCAAETCFKIFAEVGDVTTVIKGCWIPGADPTGTCKTRDSAGCYLCESDKCNSATDLKAFVLLGLVAACLLYLL